MNIFVVSEAFERPISTTLIPNGLNTLRAEECGTCHHDLLAEWRTSIHHAAWTDPYFQADFRPTVPRLLLARADEVIETD